MSEPIRKYYDNGQINYEEYWVNGETHRTDGPAVTWWYVTGQKYGEVYYVNNKRHRTDGPAEIVWDENGDIIMQEFCLDGKQVTAYDVLDEKAAFAWVMAND